MEFLNFRWSNWAAWKLSKLILLPKLAGHGIFRVWQARGIKPANRLGAPETRN